MKQAKTTKVTGLLLAVSAILVVLAAACSGTSSGNTPTPANTIHTPPNSCATVYLRADTTTVTMPDSSNVQMWGYAMDSDFGADDGTVTSPGPEILVDQNTSCLTVQLENKLPVPTSLVINGQTSELVPVRNPDGRLRSFAKETPPGNTDPVSYTFTNLKPGTYLYQSGTHVAVQVQMGLSGAMTKMYLPTFAYPGIEDLHHIVVIYSEVDPALHAAVESGNYGPGLAMTSTVEFHPKYLLINGTPLAANEYSIPVPNNINSALVRFLNAGIVSHAPLLAHSYASIVAEDGNPYPYPQERYSMLLTAGKTMDVLLTDSEGGGVGEPEDANENKIPVIADKLLFHL